jgi:6-bladed beta-propeller
VRLETLNSVVMGGIYSLVIDENYMVIGSEKEYFLFDVKGRFVRMLLKSGRGPEEFISPLFSQVIRNGVLYFSDASKSKTFIYSMDLKTGKLGRIPRYNTGYIQYFIPDTDTTFIVLSEVFERDKKIALSAIIDYSLIRQDLKGNFLNKISIGIFKGAFPFLPTRYQMFINDRDTLISTPRFDTLYRLSNFKIRPIWYNIFNTNYNNQLSIQKIPNASLVHYSDSSILFEKYITDINVNKIWNRNNQLIILDRLNNKAKIIKKLYFKDSNISLRFSSDIQLNNDQFCIVLKAKDINKMLKNPLINKSISDLIVLDPPRTDRPITDFDNPFLLIGKFRN